MTVSASRNRATARRSSSESLEQDPDLALQGSEFARTEPAVRTQVLEGEELGDTDADFTSQRGAEAGQRHVETVRRLGDALCDAVLAHRSSLFHNVTR
jgi:hypothetical protein